MGQCMSMKGPMVTGEGWKTLGHNILTLEEVVEVCFQMRSFSLKSVCLVCLMSRLSAVYIRAHMSLETSSSIPMWCVCGSVCAHSLNAVWLVFLQPAATYRHITALSYFCCRTQSWSLYSRWTQTNTHTGIKLWCTSSPFVFFFYLHLKLLLSFNFLLDRKQDIFCCEWPEFHLINWSWLSFCRTWQTALGSAAHLTIINIMATQSSFLRNGLGVTTWIF